MHVWKCDTACLDANTSVFEILEFPVSTKTRSKKKRKTLCEKISFSNTKGYILYVLTFYAFQCPLLRFMDGFDKNSDETQSIESKLNSFFIAWCIYTENRSI